MKYTAEEVRNAARLLDGLSRRMLTDYADRIEADERAVAIWQYRHEDDGQWSDCGELDADVWKQTGLHEVRKLFTHPPAQTAGVRTASPYKVWQALVDVLRSHRKPDVSYTDVLCAFDAIEAADKARSSNSV